MLHLRCGLFGLAFITCLANGVMGDVIIVPDDYATIQSAIDNALDGDEIIVAPGTYHERIDFLAKAITLRSTDPGDPAVVASTIIDGDALGTVVTCVSGEGPNTVLSGFLITGGNADEFGGGMYNLGSSPTVQFCIFEGNTAADRGGGMANNNGSNPVVTNCIFRFNTVNPDGGTSHPAFSNDGGGMNNNLSSPTVIDCTFSMNHANMDGGGMGNYDSNPIVTNCTFDLNTADDDGGGMSNYNSSPLIDKCIFSGNTAVEGGGGMVNFQTSNPTMTNCTFCDNSGVDRGGGMMNARFCDPTMTNCRFYGNTALSRGGAMANQDANPIMTNCTFYGNTAGAFGFGGAIDSVRVSTTTMTNCILWGNSPDQIATGSDVVVVASHCDVQGGLAVGTDMLDVDPQFLDIVGGDLRLASGSICIDAGDSATTGLSGINTDLDLKPRFRNATVDLGAYESDYCPGDLDGNDDVNVTDMLNMFADWGACSGPCPRDLDDDGLVSLPDLLILLDFWGACPGA